MFFVFLFPVRRLTCPNLRTGEMVAALKLTRGGAGQGSCLAVGCILKRCFLPY